jgi:uncharacterized membrane protein
MSKNRMEAFSDGVLAIIITIMVLNFSVPEGIDFQSLRHLLPRFMNYLLSFAFLGPLYSCSLYVLVAIL